MQCEAGSNAITGRSSDAANINNDSASDGDVFVQLRDDLSEMKIKPKISDQWGLGRSDIYSAIREKGDEPIENMSDGIEERVSGAFRRQRA